MDAERFDELARRFGSGMSRRHMLRGLIGGVGALAAAGVARSGALAQECDPTEDTVICPPGTFHEGLEKKPAGECCNGNGNCCSNNCVDNVCVGDPCEGVSCGPCETCSAGQCVALCEAPETCCVNGNPFCTDLDSDPGNCGACFNQCGPCEVCDQGQCVFACDPCETCNASGQCESTCKANETCCVNGNPFCTDLKTDPGNCGVCFNQCDPDCEYCADGYCLETGVCCQEKGEECEWDEDCCEDLVCRRGTCREPKPDCGRKGDICKVDDDCCRGYHCKNGTCRKKLPKPAPKPEPKPAPKPEPQRPVAGGVSTLPSTGVSGSSVDSANMAGLALAGGAAALLAARVLRKSPTGETTQD
jgi:hypothetical protein